MRASFEHLTMTANGSSYLLCRRGDDALLQTVGLLLEVLPGLVIPVQVVLNLKGKEDDKKGLYIATNENHTGKSVQSFKSEALEIEVRI